MIKQTTSCHKASAVLCRGNIMVIDGKRAPILEVHRGAGGYLQYLLQGEDALRTVHSDNNIEVED